MATRTEHAPGTPSWIDIGSPDPDATAEFYGALFGWEVPPGTEEMGGYRLATLGGKTVAGIGPQQQPGTPWWSLYVTVADADATVARAEIHNGTVIVPPMDVFDAGRMAVLGDTNGQAISIWQPNQSIGAEVVNEPGAFVWNEMSTSDVRRTHSFYEAVFDWSVDPEHSSEQSLIFSLGGRTLCGAHEAGVGEPPGWMVWFNSTDTDAAAAMVAELGGTVILPPTDMSFGRATIVADPQGAVFGIGTIDAPDD
ncbi:MAG: VOC family protein [Ilumatobacteraceae bacterium]